MPASRFSPVPLLDQAVDFDRSPSQLAGHLAQCAPVLDYGTLGSTREAFRHRSRAGQIGSLTVMAGETSPFTARFGEQSGVATINVCLRGVGQVVAGRQTFLLNHDSPLVYTPGQAHQCAVEHYLGVVIRIEHTQLLRTAQSITGAAASSGLALAELGRSQALGNRTPRTASLLSSLRASLELLSSGFGVRGRDLQCLELDDHIRRLLVLLLCPSLPGEESAHPPLEDPAARRVLDPLLEWIRAHLDHPLPLSELERRSGYSRRSLQLLFRKHLGCSPIEWVRHQRLESIHRRLLRPQAGDTVSDLAMQYGFISPSSFTREFRRRFGVAPSHVLRQARCSQETD